ncbi:hypothetical protein [Clostridium estertheticum]|uniref:hypothetical protein n=1 Tax=Clostridium estertheticum TaxID=238834 RepID=UPI001C7DB61D|nr:hypothetical protein [Clostridium estertheticum]MBX4272209.1 hypothetical protein [Clostridium estertheticum]WLC82428.1 hypothetical protein KTC98_24185 [Clostridium estertheticum]
MFRNEKNFLDELQKNKTLYNIFIYIGTYSTTYVEEHTYFKEKEVELKELITAIKTNVENKSNAIIQSYIDTLIRYGLCKYVIKNDKNPFLKDTSNDADDISRLNYYKNLGYPKQDTEIILTTEPFDYSGISLYSKIMEDIKFEEAHKKFGENLSLSIAEITKPYDDKFVKLTKELEDKVLELNGMVDSGIIKNIQVISIFAGIISLLFANIMGIKEFSSIGIKGVLTLNSSMVMAIFALILFIKLLIVGGKIGSKAIFYCLLIIALTTIPLIFL